MNEFDGSRWAEKNFSRGFREAADNFLPDRHKLIEISRSLHKHFISGRGKSAVLDLGCGDGLLVYELMRGDDRIEATLVDGSSEMLEAAKKRLAGFEEVRYVNASFQELLTENVLEDTFDLVLSSFAIHHLDMDEKEALFELVFKLMNSGGFFANIDVVAPPTPTLEEWYLQIWKEWIAVNAVASQKEKCLKTPDVYKANPDNKPDTLSAQLRALERIGFRNVDCYHKFGIFAMFGGGKKP